MYPVHAKISPHDDKQNGTPESPTIERDFGYRYNRTNEQRSRSGVTPTPDGKLAEAESLLQKARLLSHNLTLYSTGGIGKVAFGIRPLIASLVMPELSPYFINKHPTLKIKASVKPTSPNTHYCVP